VASASRDGARPAGAAPILVVLAAGRSTRFGRPKQLEALGPDGEALLDYAFYDGALAGFGSFVLVVQEAMRDAFESHVAPARQAGLHVEFCCQEARGRAKPWGTGFAVLSAKDRIDGPFAVCNADDFYGREAYATVARGLSEAPDARPVPACTVAYPLRATLSAAGGVSRGLCRVGPDGVLKGLVEGLELHRRGNRVVGRDPTGTPVGTDPDALVCTNLWGFAPELVPLLAEQFAAFLRAGPGPDAEFYLTEAVNDLIAARRVRVSVLPTRATWMGVTFPHDRDRVAAALRAMVESGVYPRRLWGRPLRAST